MAFERGGPLVAVAAPADEFHGEGGHTKVSLEVGNSSFWENGLLSTLWTSEGEGLLRQIVDQAALTKGVETG